MWYLLLAILAVILYKQEFFKLYYAHWRASKQFNGPPAYPIVGSLLQFVNKSPSEIFTILNDNISKYGNVIRVWAGTRLTIVVADAKDAEAILSSQVYIDKSLEYGNVTPWLNSGLLLSTGKKWHQRRKVITPAFHFKILEQYVDVFERQGDVFVEILKEYAKKKSFEFYPLVTMYALDVICETAMGTTINAQKNTDSAYVAAVKQESHVIQTRVFSPFLRNQFIFNLSSYAKMERESLEVLHGFTDSVIQSRRKKLAEHHQVAGVNEQEDNLGIRKKEAFLDILLKSTIDGRYLADEDIREEVDTFMFEGHDTTTSGITFCLYNLAKYQDVQAKCVQEITDVIGTDRSEKMTYANLSELNYLEKVIKETLRLYPSVPAIGRHLTKDANINGRVYPAGCNIVLQFFSMGRNPDYFKDPLAFRPERFDMENLKEINTFAYVPFSAGPRNCIGQKFAMMEMKSVLSKVLRQYQLHLIDDKAPVLYSELILRPAQPIHFRIEERS